MTGPFFVYIIETTDGTFYTGQTNNLYRRFTEHLSGKSKGARYLRAHRPEFLVHLEEFETRGEAMKRERRIQRSRRLKISLVGQRRDIREVIESEKSYR
ncbi:MAG: GIY-YIG nuclease family protein [Candidatus Thorarchaeota archaeon]